MFQTILVLTKGLSWGVQMGGNGAVVTDELLAGQIKRYKRLRITNYKWLQKQNKPIVFKCYWLR